MDGELITHLPLADYTILQVRPYAVLRNPRRAWLILPIHAFSYPIDFKYLHASL